MSWLSTLINGNKGNSGMPPPIDPTQDQNAINQFMQQTQDRYTQQQQQLGQLLNNYRTNAEQQLTTGPEGEALRQKYNNLGLLNSGAFNSALAQDFSQIQQNSDQALMQQGLNTTDVLQGIADSGLQRQFGIEDQNYQGALNQALAKQRQSSQNSSALLGLGGSLLGSAISGPLGGSLGGMFGSIFSGGSGGGQGNSSAFGQSPIPRSPYFVSPGNLNLGGGLYGS